MAIIIPDHSLTFIHIPKTGGTSITRWLKENTNTLYYRKHCTVDVAKTYINNLGTTFCVIRNPYDWLVSWFEYEKIFVRERIADIESGNIKQFKINPEKDNLILLKEKICNLENNGFDYFARTTNKEPQIKWAKDVDIRINFNNLEKEFRRIQLMINCHKPLEKINSSDRTNTEHYYTPKLKKFVSKKYSKDFELFYKN